MFQQWLVSEVFSGSERGVLLGQICINHNALPEVWRTSRSIDTRGENQHRLFKRVQSGPYQPSGHRWEYLVFTGRGWECTASEGFVFHTIVKLIKSWLEGIKTIHKLGRRMEKDRDTASYLFADELLPQELAGLKHVGDVVERTEALVSVLVFLL